MPLPRSYMEVGAGVYPSRFLRMRSRMIPEATRIRMSASAMARPIRTTKTSAKCFSVEEHVSREHQILHRGIET